MLTRRCPPAAQSPNYGFGIRFRRTKKKRVVEFASGLFRLENTKLQAAASQPPREASAVASAEKAGGRSAGETRRLWAPPLLVWLWCRGSRPSSGLGSSGQSLEPPCCGLAAGARGPHPPRARLLPMLVGVWRLRVPAEGHTGGPERWDLSLRVGRTHTSAGPASLSVS